jgi:hypothetical protein
MSDAVFGVKSSLLVDLAQADQALAEMYNVPIGTKVLRHDFILVSEQDTIELRAKNSREAMSNLGHRVKIVDGLPVPDID